MIILVNPRSTTPGKQPLPISLLSLAAVLEGRERWSLVDGNIFKDPAAEVLSRARKTDSHEPLLIGVTVMPGPQLTQAVAICRTVRAARPDIPIVWGGYFPTQHRQTVLRSSFVDFVIRSQGEAPLLELARAVRAGSDPAALATVPSLSWKTAGGEIVDNTAGPPCTESRRYLVSPGRSLPTSRRPS